MKTLVKISLLTMLIAMVSVSCSKDEEATADLTKPTATIELDQEAGKYFPGGAIVINAEFKDDTALKECQISVQSKRSLKGWDTDWDYDTDKIKLSGTTFEVNRQQVLPRIPYDIYYGDYQLTFKVLDQANNYTEYIIDFTISD